MVENYVIEQVLMIFVGEQQEVQHSGTRVL